ncbi:MAG TPA: hypothetical protein VK048_03740 [Atopostipes sp.]|nr:hypothetical protein [Atopostipes sp.]
MLYKARFFFVTMVASLFLMACHVDTIEDTVIESATEETTEVNADTNSTEHTETHSTTEEAKSTAPSENNEANTNAEQETKTKTATATAENPSEQETANFTYQDAVNQFIAATGLNIEEYTFTFAETAEYIEISVYEKPTEGEDQAHTPLVGNYRYMMDTAEILVQDYLTGAFIPFEEAEETE